MNRIANIVCLSLALAPVAAAAQPAAGGLSSSVIYKFVDEQGRVTYANSPIRGGAKVDLEPLTVIPSTPSGSLSNGSGGTKSAPAKPAPDIPAPLAAPSASAPSENRVAMLVPTESRALNADAVQQLAVQRRAETRKRILESETQTEEDMLVAARAKLSEEQRGSGNYRAMRASFAATPEAVTAQRPLIAPDTRAEIERHFERIRNLQDQVSMHEGHLHELREQLARLK
jgi:hypothetical protein